MTDGSQGMPMQPPVRIAADTQHAFLLRSLHRRWAQLGGLFWPTKAEAVLGGERAAVLLVDSQRIETSADWLEHHLARPEVRAALRTHLVLVLDACGEGYPLRPDMLAAWHAAIDRHGVPAGRIAHLTHNEAAEATYVAWLRSTGRQDRIRILQHHPFLDEQVEWMRHALADPVERMARLQSALAGPASVRARARFLCLNNRAHPHRMAIVGRLARRGLLEGCVLSFANATEEMRTSDLAPRVAKAREALPRFGADLDAFAQLIPRLPIAIPGDVVAKAFDVVYRVPLPLYRRALFSLVGETDFGLGGVARFTEKSVKALAGGHPAIIAGLPGTLGLLRAHGFATFAPYIDEGYDTITDAEDRLEALLDEVERIARLPEAATAALLRRCLPAVEHNLRHFTEGLPALLARRLGELAQSLAWMAEPADP